MSSNTAVARRGDNPGIDVYFPKDGSRFYNPETGKFADGFFRDALTGEFRAIDLEKRMASFVAATENGVLTYRGKEVLRVAGISLDRFKRNPVVLDTHDRYSVEAIVGRADMRVEGKQLVADVYFAETSRGNAAWSLVEKGFLRAVSIGFIPDPASIVDLRQGQFDGEGDSRVEGPARVINRSEAFELSVVPVPADPDALRRQFEELSMSKETQPAAPAAAQTSAPAVAPATQERRIEPINTEVAGEIFRREVSAIAPRSLSKDVVDSIILESNGDLGKARTRLMEEHKKFMPPVGTPEPAAVEKPAEQQRAKEGEQVKADEGLLVRSLCAPARSE